MTQPASNPQLTLEYQPYPLPIAGFWQRFFASLVDSLIISVILLTPTIVFREFFFKIGPYGRFFGWAVAVAYFTYYHSSWGEGQTPGKRMMNITVRNRHGNTLAWQHAFMRAQALCIIILFNFGWQFKPIRQDTFGNIIYGVAYIGGILTIIYGIIINRATKQGPHDLLVGSYVVEKKSEYSGSVVPEQPSAFYFWMVVLLLFGGFIGLSIDRFQDQGDLLKVLNEDDRYYIIVASRIDDRLSIRAWYDDQCEADECERLIEEIRNIAIITYPEISDIKTLEISLVNKIDVNPILILEVSSVFTRQVEGYRFTFSPVPIE